jgi:hypothetical protein
MMGSLDAHRDAHRVRRREYRWRAGSGAMLARALGTFASAGR